MSSGTFGLGPFTPIHPAVDWMSLMCACIYSETVMMVINFVAVSISHAVIATAELVGGACRFIWLNTRMEVVACLATHCIGVRL